MSSSFIHVFSVPAYRRFHSWYTWKRTYGAGDEPDHKPRRLSFYE